MTPCDNRTIHTCRIFQGEYYLILFPFPEQKHILTMKNDLVWLFLGGKESLAVSSQLGLSPVSRIFRVSYGPGYFNSGSGRIPFFEAAKNSWVSVFKGNWERRTSSFLSALNQNPEFRHDYFLSYVRKAISMYSINLEDEMCIKNHNTFSMVFRKTRASRVSESIKAW